MPEVLGDYPDYGLIYPVNEPLDSIIRPNFLFDFSSFSNPGNASGASIVDWYGLIDNTIPAVIDGDPLFGEDNAIMAISSSVGELTSGGYKVSAGIRPNSSYWVVSLSFLYDTGAIVASLTSDGNLSLTDTVMGRLASKKVESSTNISGVFSLSWDGVGRFLVSWGDDSITGSLEADVYGAIPILSVRGEVVSYFSGAVASGLDSSPSGYSRGVSYGQIIVDGNQIPWPGPSSSGEDSDSGASLTVAVAALAEESITPFLTLGYIPSHFTIAPQESSDTGNWISNASFGVDPILSSDLTPASILVNFKTTDHSANVQGIHKEYPVLAEHTLVGLRLEDVAVEPQAFDPEVVYSGDFIDISDFDETFVPALVGSDLSAATFSILLDDIAAESGSGAAIPLSGVQVYGSELIGCRITDLEVNTSSSISGLNVSVAILDSSGDLIYGEATITGDATTGPGGPPTLNVINSGSSSYTINGSSNPTILLARGATYVINVNAVGHPFWIQTVPGAYSAGDIYSTGVTNGGTDSGAIIFEVPLDAPQLYYACQSHSSMAGSITVSTPLNNWIETSISGGATPIPDAAGITLVEEDPSEVIAVELNWASGADAASLAIILSANDGAPVTPDSITLSGVELLYSSAPIKVDIGLIDSEGNGVAGSASVSTMGGTTPNDDWEESSTYAQTTLLSQSADTCDITFVIDRVGDGENKAAIIAYGPEYPVSIGFSAAFWIFEPAYSLEIVDGPEDYASEIVDIAEGSRNIILGRTSGRTNLADYVEIFNMIVSDSGWPASASLCGPNTHIKARDDDSNTDENHDTAYTAGSKTFIADSRDIQFLLDYIEESVSNTALLSGGLAFSAEYETVDEWLGLVRFIREYLNPGIRIIITSIFNDNISMTDVKDIVDAFNDEMLGYDIIFVSASESASTFKQTIRSGTPPPSIDDGARGDFYIDTDSSDPVEIYGPKGIGSSWGPPIALDYPSVEMSTTAPVDESVLWFRSGEFVNSVDFSKYSPGAVAQSLNPQTGLPETSSTRRMASITNGYGSRDPSSIVTAADSSGSCLIVDGHLSASTSGSITVPPRQSSGAIFFRTLDFADGTNIRLNARLGNIISGLDHPVLNVAGYTIPSLVFSIGNHVLNDPSINPLTGWDVYDSVKVTVCFPTQASGVATTTKIIMEVFCSENGETTDFSPQEAITVANMGNVSQDNYFRNVYTLNRALLSGDVLSIVSDGGSDIDLELNGDTIASAATWLAERTGEPMSDLNQVCVMSSFVERSQNANGASHVLPVTSVDVMLGTEYEFDPQGIFYHNGSDWVLVPQLRSLGRAEFYYPVDPVALPVSYAWVFESTLETPIDLYDIKIGMLIYSRNMINGIMKVVGEGRSIEFPLSIDSISSIVALEAGTYDVTLYGDVRSSGVETLRFGISADNMSRLIVSDTVYIKGAD